MAIGNINSYSSSFYNSFYGGSSSSMFNKIFNTRSASSYYDNNYVKLNDQLFNYNYVDTFYGKNIANTINYKVTKFLTTLKSESGALKKNMDSLKGNDSKTSAFIQKTATSSDTEYLTVKSSNNNNNNNNNKNTLPATSVNIKQIATNQINKGDSLSSNQKLGTNKSYQFEISTNNKTYQFSFSLSANDTVKTLQEKMASSINSKNIGVTASVSTSSGTSALTIQSKYTGDDIKNNFTIRDMEGDAVEKTGTSNVGQEAQDAIYSVNGGEQKTSKSNNVDIGNGVTATLKKATDKAVAVTIGNDKDYALDRVEEMVAGFNKMLEAAQSNSKDVGSARLYNQLSGASKTYSYSLDNIGINVDKNGYLSIDSDKLKDSSENGNLESFFTENSSSNYGFANRVSKIADNVNQNPTNYVSKSQLSEPNSISNSSYYNENNEYSASSYYNTLFKYNMLSNTGLLFESLF